MLSHETWSNTRTAWHDFQASCHRLKATQDDILQAIVRNNANSIFGREHGFSSIRNYTDFITQVPLSTYDDHHPAIVRLTTGETNLLTVEPIRLFEETGGSTAGAKLIPYTDSLLAAFRRALLPWLADLINQRPLALTGRLFFVISPATRQTTHTTGDIPIGSGDDLAYLGEELTAFLGERTLFLPELQHMQSAEQWQWHCARLLLNAPGLSLMSAWSPTLLLAILHTMHTQQDSLLATVNERTHRAQLSLALSADKPDTRRIWPQLDTVSCWMSHTSAAPAAELQQLLPHAFFQGKGLLATEGVTSIPFGPHPQPLLAVNSHFYEFATDDGQIFRAHELQRDTQYRIILTTQGGLYRYDSGDCVQVSDFTGKVPRLLFVGRSTLFSDLCGEKLNESFVRRAMMQTDPRLAEYCLLQGVRSQTTHKAYYRIVAPACAHHWLTTTVLRKLDDALQVNPQYAYARRISQLDSLQIWQVANPTVYATQLAKQQQRLGTRKIPLLLPPVLACPGTP